MHRLLQFVITGLFLCVHASAETLSQEAYIWQRTWAGSVQEAVRQQGSAFDGLSILAAEVSWKGSAPAIARPEIDYLSLQKSGCRFGLVMRVQSFKDAQSAASLSVLARQLVAEVRAHALSPYELQVDFDCPQSRLQEYARWLKKVRESVAPLPVTFTALPSWLREPEFVPLARSSPGYVLQVHSLRPPITLSHPATLCDTNVARAAVEQANRLGVPFRVALPTYAYVLAFDEQGGFIGLSAEGPRRNWPAGSQLRELWADPRAIAALVRDWTAEPPGQLQGFIWYRFPVPGDLLNWRWPTLAATMTARSPQPCLEAELHPLEPGLYEIGLLNKGELDMVGPLTVLARWSKVRITASDGLLGWQPTHSGGSPARFAAPAGFRLPAGDRRVIGWLRLSGESEVKVEIRQD